MDRWEFNFWNDLSVSQLNELGEKGWELVSVVPLQEGRHNIFRYYFKRRLEDSIFRMDMKAESGGNRENCDD